MTCWIVILPCEVLSLTLDVPSMLVAYGVNRLFRDLVNQELKRYGGFHKSGGSKGTVQPAGKIRCGSEFMAISDDSVLVTDDRGVGLHTVRNVPAYWIGEKMTVMAVDYAAGNFMVGNTWLANPVDDNFFYVSKRVLGQNGKYRDYEVLVAANPESRSQEFAAGAKLLYRTGFMFEKACTGNRKYYSRVFVDIMGRVGFLGCTPVQVTWVDFSGVTEAQEALRGWGEAAHLFCSKIEKNVVTLSWIRPDDALHRTFGRFINPTTTTVNGQYVDWLCGDPLGEGSDCVACRPNHVVKTQSGKAFAVPKVDPVRFLGGVMQRKPTDKL